MQFTWAELGMLLPCHPKLAIRRLLIYMPCTGGSGNGQGVLPTESALLFDEVRHLLGLLCHASPYWGIRTPHPLMASTGVRKGFHKWPAMCNQSAFPGLRSPYYRCSLKCQYYLALFAFNPTVGKVKILPGIRTHPKRSSSSALSVRNPCRQSF